MRTQPMVQRHPGLARGGAVAAVSAIINVLISFGVPITPEQTEAIAMCLAIVGPVVAGWWATRTRTAAEAAPSSTEPGQEGTMSS